jgi:prolyl-tRNA editing enzyme YbaK/EbsC (Cys-tRNA(Pro) deacylase)
VVRADDRPVHLVLPADRRVDNARLRRLLDARRLRFVTPDELQALTGCVPGAVPPFGNLFGLDVLVDEELTRCEEIAFNAGSRTVSITMRCADFVRLTGRGSAATSRIEPDRRDPLGPATRRPAGGARSRRRRG